MIAVDAGPLVALFNRRDAHHARCVSTLEAIRESCVTTWPALTEAFYLLGASWKAQEALFEMIRREAIEIEPLDGDLHRMQELMKKYADLPMDLADASLVAMCEKRGVRTVFTIDRSDFRLYRPRHIPRFRIIPAAG